MSNLRNESSKQIAGFYLVPVSIVSLLLGL